MLKVGLVGTGYWGPNLARVLNQTPKCAFVAACDVSPKSLEKITHQYPTLTAFSSFEEFLKSDIDAVVIATPISTHYELAKKALLAGKHVFVEKPITDAASQAWDLVALAAKSKRTLFTGHTFIYSPPVIKVKEMIDRGDLGDIYSVTLSRVNLGLYRSDVDVVWDLAVHDISILLYWLGEMPIRGASFGRACVQAAKRDVAFLWLEFPSGIVAQNEVSWLSPQKMRRTYIKGSKRMVVYDDMDAAEKIKVYDRGVNVNEPSTFGEFQLTYRMGDMYAPYLENAEPLLREVEHFIDCCETGKPPLTSGEFGARVVETLEMVNQSDFSNLTLNNASKPKSALEAADTKPFFQHPLALVDSEQVGADTRIWAWAHVLKGAEVGTHCNIGEHSYIENNARLGNHVTVKNGVSIWSGVTVEDNCFLGPNCAFTNDLNPRAYIKKDAERLQPTLVRSGASIGANATIVCGNTIGRYAFVGAGATVTSDVADHALVVGTPARQIAWMCTCAQKIPLSQKQSFGEPLRCEHCGCEYTETSLGLIPKSVQSQN